MTTKVFLPYRAEFGFICMFHAPQVNAVEGPKAVIIEKGMEALYPNCDYFYVPQREDAERRARVEKELIAEVINSWADRLLPRYGAFHFIEPDQKASRKYFVPEPAVPVPPNINMDSDVVVCPRKREYGSDKNWKHWEALVEGVAGYGLDVVAVGHPDTSFHLSNCLSAWELWPGGKYLDATIVMMQQAKLVIATDNGLAHLAMMMGKPLLLISHADGLVADGKDDVGRSYWPIKLHRYYEENHKGVHIEVVKEAWYDVEPVLECVGKHPLWQGELLHGR